MEADLEKRIAEQGDLVRSLKASKAPQEKIDAEVATLLKLKSEHSASKPEKKKTKDSFTLKNAKV